MKLLLVAFWMPTCSIHLYFLQGSTCMRLPAAVYKGMLSARLFHFQSIATRKCTNRAVKHCSCCWKKCAPHHESIMVRCRVVLFLMLRYVPHNQPHAVLILIVSLGGRKVFCLTWWWLFQSWMLCTAYGRTLYCSCLIWSASKMLGISMSCSFSIVWLATMLDVLLVKDKYESGSLGGLSFQHNCTWND
jgi:hypothetical protein